MTEDEFFGLVSKLFILEQNPKLEKKAWFRFLKVLQGLAIVVVVLAALIVAWVLFDSKSTATATLICNDGTTWNAIDQSESYRTYKSELDMYEKCGLCNYRLPNDRYNECEIGTPSNILFDSYEVEKTYSRDHSIVAVVGWSSLALFGGLALVKISAKTIVYVIGGGRND
ncbi:hypothetical protein KO465_09160 [Candidatus Micrarchaeota archaeon]|jgi:hypothetical protein|nr:hypothetical protein [Candidatus Micrarchaeota archaeon]